MLLQQLLQLPSIWFLFLSNWLELVSHSCSHVVTGKNIIFSLRHWSTLLHVIPVLSNHERIIFRHPYQDWEAMSGSESRPFWRLLLSLHPFGLQVFQIASWHDRTLVCIPCASSCSIGWNCSHQVLDYFHSARVAVVSVLHFIAPCYMEIAKV